MPAVEVPDAEELGGNVTKPFKFVTGTHCSVPWHTSTMTPADNLTAGYDARFPNQNQCVPWTE
jgi:hypothetical protein